MFWLNTTIVMFGLGVKIIEIIFHAQRYLPTYQNKQRIKKEHPNIFNKNKQNH